MLTNLYWGGGREAYFDALMSNQLLITIVTVGSFVILAAIIQCTMPSLIHHMLRDLVLRYMGTFMIIALFYNHKELFYKDTSINRIISYIGRYTLPIYLLHYFFMPDLTKYSGILENMDMLMVNIVCFGYSIVITFLCVIFIWIISNSVACIKYILGHKN